MPIDNETLGAAVAIAKANPASEQAITNAVNDWLDDHPEATTTVQDGSITKAKLENDLQVKVDELATLKSTLQAKPETKESDAEDVDLDITDPNGNVLVRFENGHVHTKNFDSNNIMNTRETVDADPDLDISDNTGNVLMRLQDGHIKTKAFDSEQMTETLDDDTDRIAILEDAIANINVTPIPDYWKSTLAEKEAQINTYNQASGADGITFVFITDYHQNTSNNASFPLIKHILANTSVRDVVYGGDTTDGGAYNRTRCVEIIKEFGLKWREINTIFVRGNHDILPQATDTEKKVTDAEYYDICLRPLEKIATLEGKPYYYVDNKSAKTRYIVLDTGANVDLIDATQVTFLKESLTELGSGWTAIIFLHWAISTNVEQHTFVLSEHGTRVVGAIHDVYEDLNCEIAAIIAGHSHVDVSTTTEDGIPLILTTCDSGGANSVYDWNNPTRPVGTTGECAFDVFCINRNTKTINTVRVGSGENRSFNY